MKRCFLFGLAALAASATLQAATEWQVKPVSSGTTRNSYQFKVPVGQKCDDAVAFVGGNGVRYRHLKVTTSQGSFDAYVECVQVTLPDPEQPLRVTVSGSGNVRSAPEGISCTADCSHRFPLNSAVTLTATPAAGYTFAGWSGGGCSGTAACTVTLTAATQVTASFAAAPVASACANFYPPNFVLREGMTTDPIAPLAKPAPGVPVAEPAYGTCLVRVTDHATQPPVNFARNDYSRRQAFNADNSLQLVVAGDGYWHVYRADTNQHQARLPGLAGDAEPQWHPANPDLLYYLPTNGVGMQVYELNVRTGTSRTVGDLASRLRARWPGANTASTRSEGSPSADGRYWCLMVDDVNWNSLGVVTWDLAQDRIIGFLNTNGERPDHVSMSHSGNYCVVSHASSLGTIAYTPDFATRRQLHHWSEHSDLALDANGDDAYVSVDYQTDAGEVFMVNLRTGVRTFLFRTYLEGTATALHFSGRAYQKPGWVLASTYADYGGARQWLHRKLFAVELKATPRILPLAHTRVVSNGYWSEPHASVNRDFTRVTFNSNWDVNSETNVDTYRIELPPGSVR